MAGTNFIQAIHHLKISKEFFQDIQRQCAGRKGAAIAKGYEAKIEWIFKDLLSNPNFDNAFREGLKAEWSSDAFVPLAIMEKVAQLTPENREKLETVVDSILKGESIDITLKAEKEDAMRL